MACDDHAPKSIPAAASGGWTRGRWRARLRGACRPKGGRTTQFWPQKIVENRSTTKPSSQRHERQTLPLRNLSRVLFYQQTKKKLKNINLHSPKGLGGRKSPPDLVWGDKNSIA
jgi:hypothetical protein